MKYVILLTGLALLASAAQAEPQATCFHGTTCSADDVRTGPTSIEGCAFDMEGEYPYSWGHTGGTCFVVQYSGAKPRRVTAKEVQAKARPGGEGMCYHNTSCSPNDLRTGPTSVGGCQFDMEGEYPFSWRSSKTHICYVVEEHNGGATPVSTGRRKR